MNKVEINWKFTVAVFFLGWLVMGLTRQVITPLQLEIQNELGISSTQLGLINSIFFIATVLIQIPAGRMGDKMNKALILGASFIFFGLASIASGLAGSFLAILAARALTGLGQGFFYSNQFALSSTIIPAKNRILGNALINSGNAVGVIIGFNVSAFIAFDMQLGWRAPFIISAVPAIILGVLYYFAFNNIEKERIAGIQSAESARKCSSCSIFSWSFALVCTVIFCSIFAFFLLITWLPVFLEEAKGMNKADAALLASASAWASVPASIIVAKASSKLKHSRGLISVLFILSAAAVAGVVAFDQYSWLLVCLVFYGAVGKIASDPLIIALIPEIVPGEKLSSAFGVFNFIGMSGAIAAAQIPATLNDFGMSWDASFILAAVLLAVSAAASMLLPCRR